MQEDSVPLLSLVREPSSFGPVPGKVSSEESGPLRGTRKPCSAARPSDDTDCHILLLPFQVLPFYSHTPPHTHCHRTINIRNALGLQISNMNLEVGEVGRGTACGGGGGSEMPPGQLCLRRRRVQSYRRGCALPGCVVH